VAAAAGLAAGALAVGAVWLGTSLSGPGNDDAAAACDLAGEFPTMTPDNLDEPYISRLEAIQGLGKSAAFAGPRYDGLAKDTTAAYTAMVSFDVDALNKSIKAVRTDCGGL
jgi:hypothetical protein